MKINLGMLLLGGAALYFLMKGSSAAGAGGFAPSPGAGASPAPSFSPNPSEVKQQEVIPTKTTPSNPSAFVWAATQAGEAILQNNQVEAQRFSLLAQAATGAPTPAYFETGGATRAVYDVNAPGAYVGPVDYKGNPL